MKRNKCIKEENKKLNMNKQNKKNYETKDKREKEEIERKYKSSKQEE